ncbi:MAG: TetR/AcrR family transcriptional regulator, partial [Pseudodesulfovibrio sp.]
MSNEKATRTPRQARSIEKRRRLMDAAMRLFDRDGFEGTTAKAVAREAGVSIGTFYAYFSDKKELLMDILAEHTGEVHHLVFGKLGDAVRDGASGREIMRLAVAAGHATHWQPPGLLRVLLALRHTDDDMRRFQEAEERALLTRLHAILKILAPRLRVTDREAAAFILATAFEAVLHSAIVFEQDIERERLFDALADMGAAYLFADPDA